MTKFNIYIICRVHVGNLPRKQNLHARKPCESSAKGVRQGHAAKAAAKADDYNIIYDEYFPRKPPRKILRKKSRRESQNCARESRRESFSIVEPDRYPVYDAAHMFWIM